MMGLSALHAMQEVQTPDGKGIVIGRCFKNGTDLGLLISLRWNASTSDNYEKPPRGIGPCEHRIYQAEQLEAMP